jgi:hypothetical protein
MSEFMFKNLAVKLFPTTGGATGATPCAGTSAAVCRPPTSLCHVPSFCHVACSQTVSMCQGPLSVMCCIASHAVSGCTGACSVLVSAPCFGPSACGQISAACQASVKCPGGSACGGSIVEPDQPAGDARAELAALKEQLRQALAEVEASEAALAEAGKPQTVEQVDMLKDQLMQAVAELDERRAELEGR